MSSKCSLLHKIYYKQSVIPISFFFFFFFGLFSPEKKMEIKENGFSSLLQCFVISYVCCCCCYLKMVFYSMHIPIRSVIEIKSLELFHIHWHSKNTQYNTKLYTYLFQCVPIHKNKNCSEGVLAK